MLTPPSCDSRLPAESRNPPFLPRSFRPRLRSLNYLAHLFLAENHAASRIGNLLGDFVTGRPETLELPEAVVAGIVRHREIDRFTDQHPVVAGARAWFTGVRCRFANPLVDVCLDHFLARHWNRFHPLPMRDFLDQVNGELSQHRDWLPPELGNDLDERIADDWLGHYGTLEGLEEVFHRIARRRPACTACATAMIDVRSHYGGLEQVFETIMPEVIRWVSQRGPERLAPAP